MELNSKLKVDPAWETLRQLKLEACYVDIMWIMAHEQLTHLDLNRSTISKPGAFLLPISLPMLEFISFEVYSELGMEARTIGGKWAHRVVQSPIPLHDYNFKLLECEQCLGRCTCPLFAGT